MTKVVWVVCSSSLYPSLHENRVRQTLWGIRHCMQAKPKYLRKKKIGLRRMCMRPIRQMVTHGGKKVALTSMNKKMSSG